MNTRHTEHVASRAGDTTHLGVEETFLDERGKQPAEQDFRVRGSVRDVEALITCQYRAPLGVQRYVRANAIAGVE